MKPILYRVIARLARLVRNGCRLQALKIALLLVPATWQAGVTLEATLLWACVLFLVAAAWWGGRMARWAARVG